MSSLVSKLVIMRSLGIQGHPPKASIIKQVIWYPPICYFIKCNTDGAAKGCPGPAACGGIFRDSSAAVIGCFSTNLGIANAFYAELMGAMLAIEFARLKGWSKLWLECDSKLVVSAFTNPSSVLWRLQNRWNNCLLITANMQFLVSHIFREGNTCADKLADFGLSVVGSVWWDSIPSFVTEEFFRNRNGLPNYRFR